MVIPLFVGRPKSFKAMEIAMERARAILLVAQKIRGQGRAHCRRPVQDRCISNILQMLKLPTAPSKCWWKAASAPGLRDIDDMRSHYVSEPRPSRADAGDVTEIEPWPGADRAVRTVREG